ncbi:MAG: RNA polymerase sigma factor [Nitriliruptoraceae bacterium]
MTDEVLLARYLAGDAAPSVREAAFHELIDRYHRRVFGVCLRALGSASDAEDATQETFLKLARNAASFRGDAKLSTWLYRVARNVCTDHIRRDARHPSTPVADPAAVTAAPQEADRTASTEEAMTVRAALAQLDPSSRHALVLVAVEGLSYEDAGAALDLPVGTVKSRVSRARARLAGLLTEASHDPPSTADTRATSGPPDASNP